MTIYPKQESLKDYISDSGYGNRNINFVADAFLDLKKSMQSLYSKSIIDSAAGIYINLNPQETYIDSPNLYINHLNNLFTIFNTTYLSKIFSIAKSLNIVIKKFFESIFILILFI